LVNADSTVRTVRVFVSSPVDVASERGRVQAVAAKLNRDFEGLVRFETVLWEEHFYKADRSFQPQIPEAVSCDVLVSIFWTRVGTELPADFARMPNGKPYPSGTAYELLTALEASKSNGVPDVYVFRKTADMALPAADRDRRRQAQVQLDALEAFWTEWFKSEQGHFKAAFQSFATTDEFERQVEQLLRQWLESHGLLGPRLKWPKEKGSPFRGLAPFEAEHAAVFFGRDRMIDEARRRLATAAEHGTPFLLIVGASGSGKSSLARAGLIPRLTTSGVVASFDTWRCGLLRPSQEQAGPLGSLATALYAALPELAQGDYPTADALADNLRRGGSAAARPVVACLARIAEAVQRDRNADRPLQAGLVLLVDQLEELFAQTVDDSERNAFAEALKELAATGKIWCIATLRADLYELLLRQPALKALKESGASLDLGPPGAAELAEIVRAPAAAAGLTFESNAEKGALDARLLDDAKTADSLPLLQFTLRQLYERRTESDAAIALTHAAYDALGGLQGAIAAEAERAVAGLPPGGLGALPRLLRQLAEPARDGTTLTLRDAPQAVLTAEPTQAALIDALLGARILIARQDASGRPTLRLAHDAVLTSWPAAADAAQASREFYRIRADVEDAMHRWQERGRGKDRLIRRGVPLAEAEKLVADFGSELPGEVATYVGASRNQARAQQRLVAAAAVFFAVLAVAATATGIWAFAERSRAETGYNAARAAVDGLIFNITQGLQNVEGMRTEAIVRILETTRQTVDKLVALNPNDPALQNSRATMLFNFGRTYARANDIERASSNADAALAAYRALLARFPNNRIYKRNVAVALELVARIKGLSRGDLKGALVAADEDVALRREIAANDQDRIELATALSLLVSLRRDSGDISGSAAAAQEALALRRDLASREPGNIQRQSSVADSLKDVAAALTLKGDFEAANELSRQAVDIRKRLSEVDSTNAGLQDQYAGALLDVGDDALRKKDLAAARQAYEQSVAIRQKLYALDPQHSGRAVLLSLSMEKLAVVKQRSGDIDGARQDTENVIAMRRKLVANDPNNATWQHQLEAAVHLYGELQLQAGQTQSALASFDEGIQILRKAVALSPDHAIVQIQLVTRLETVARLRTRGNDLQGAEAAYREAIDIMTQLVARDGNNKSWVFELGGNRDALGDVFRSQNRVPEAAREYEAAFAGFQKLAQAEPNDPAVQRTFAAAYDKLGDTALAQNAPAAAFEDYQAGLAIRQRFVLLGKEPPPWRSDLQQSVDKIGGVAFYLLVARDFTAALAAADQAIAVKPDLVWLYTNRAHALMFLGRTDEARALYLKYRDDKNVQDGKSWPAAIVEDFAELRKQGLSDPLMDEIEKKFASAG
jgi:tetratricopeptide (TPR) repeat protein